MEGPADFARRAAHDLPGNDPIFVASDGDDADPVAPPLLAALEAAAREVGHACLWTEIVEHGSEISLAPIKLQYVEDGPRTGRFVVLLSAYGSFVEARTFLMRFVHTHLLDRILVLCGRHRNPPSGPRAGNVENLLSRMEIVEGEPENCSMTPADRFKFPAVVMQRRAARREARNNAGTEHRAVTGVGRPR